MFMNQKGFTLIELMLALALGLVISAAAIMLFLTGQKSYSLQQGMSNVQDNANFGLNYITKDIRHANLNNADAGIDSEAKFSGIVFTSMKNANRTSTTDSITTYFSNLPDNIKDGNITAEFLTNSKGLSNGSGLQSDQLVIQYLPQYRLIGGDWYGGYDCEGKEIRYKKLDSVPDGRHIVVQRYFLREDSNKEQNEPGKPLALACDAGRYQLDDIINTKDLAEPKPILDYGDNGQIIMKRVDHMRVLYGIVDEKKKTFKYVSAADYIAIKTNPPRIVSVQIGLLTRSLQSVAKDDVFKESPTFQVLDQSTTIKTSKTDPNYVRQVLAQTIALRNAFGDRE